jgi:hypothetical protein
VEATGFRFHPPATEISPDLRWVLLRAFGPAGSPFHGVSDGASVFQTAKLHDLAARIGSRAGREALTVEIGGAAALFLRESQRNADEAIVSSLAAQDAAVVARELGIPLVYLKFQALTASGYVAGNARGSSDADLLVPGADSARYRQGLLERGFRSSGGPEYEHQTSAVIHPYGVEVDVHRKILGVRVVGGRSADARDLLEAGLCAPLAGFPGEPAVPVRGVLIAHALAHGVSQNGLAPHAYPLFRMIADLIDLGFPGEEGGLREWEPWILRDVSRVEISAIARFCARLRCGESLDRCGVEERAFLTHIVAAGADSGYSKSLALARILREPTDHSRASRVLRTVVGGLLRRASR